MDKIGNYELIGAVGQGGMCTVYRGRQVSLDRTVAVKVLSDKLVKNADVQARFDRESYIIAQLNHPNIIHVIDRGITDEGRPYFVMEYVEGITLGSVIKDDCYTLNQKLELLIQVCKALSYAHRNGVIHRDIKPANILIDDEHHVHVLDFGIAKFFDESREEIEQTRADLVMGTLAYMSPEQQTGMTDVTTASDIYSLGVVMYELFTSVKPMGNFTGPMEINDEIPFELDAIIMKCLNPEPDQRAGSPDEIKDCFLSLLQGAHLATAQRERASVGLAKVEDKFTLLDVVRETEYGATYLYQDQVDQRLIIIKKILGGSIGLAEAKKLTTLKHQNIVNILGASGDKQRFIMVLEYLTGGNLKERLLQPMPWGEALDIIRQVCKALSFAHRNRIVHGNLRPSNIMFTENGRVRVTDFSLLEQFSFDENVTNWYNIWGEKRSVSSDVFAVGVIIYEMVTGEPPAWDGLVLAPNEYFEALPLELQTLMKRMIASDPQRRHSSISQAMACIDTLLAACNENPQLPGATVVIDLTTIGAASGFGGLMSKLAAPFARLFRKKSKPAVAADAADAADTAEAGDTTEIYEREAA